MSPLSGFHNIWMGEGKSVYHDGDHNGRLLKVRQCLPYLASVTSGWARVSQCIMAAITRVDCCRYDDVFFIWLP